jgi:quinol-cytochrome oxidoreductase complex cytochrome b subunit
MWNILSNVPLGQLMRNLHRFGAEMMVLVVALHMLRTYVTGSYKKPRQFTWLTGMILLCFTLVLSFSGYLLPWDQLAYWAVTVAVSATSALASLPLPGSDSLATNLDLLVRGAPSIGAGGLLRFYLLHVLALPLLTAIFIFVHYYKVVLHGHSLPPGREAIGEDTAKRVPRNERVYFTPDILTNELMWTALATLFLVVGALWFANVPIESHANPQVTPLHVVAPWYLSWSQGWLKFPIEFLGLPSAFWVAFVIIPGLATLFFIWPYIEVGKSRRYADRHYGLALSMFFIAFMLVSNWMGSPKFLVRGSADQEVAQEVMPQEGHSPILETPYEELAAGNYFPGQVTGQEHLDHALEEFLVAMSKFSCYVESVPEAQRIEGITECDEVEVVTEDGLRTRYDNFFTESAMPLTTGRPRSAADVDTFPAKLVITDYTHNLKRIDMTFAVPDPDDPNALLFEYTRTKYRHLDSNYEEY